MTPRDSLRIIDRAHAAKTPEAVKHLLAAARERVEDAKQIPWDALIQSWQQTVEVLEAILERRQAEQVADQVDMDEEDEWFGVEILERKKGECDELQAG